MGPLWGSHTVPHLHGTRPATDPPPPTGSSFSFLGSWARPCVQLVMFWLLRDTFVPPGRREQEPGNQGTEGNRLQSILGGPGEACSSSMFQMSPTSHPPLLPVCPPASVQAAWGPPPAPCSPLQKPRALLSKSTCSPPAVTALSAGTGSRKHLVVVTPAARSQ